METDFEQVRATVLNRGVRKRVEVNQRALIDKILARYASPNALYRELLQNSNDAAAQTAEVHFATVPTDKGPCIRQVVYRNDGQSFSEEDWERLRKIAQGNPDANKVGAFGVGTCAMFSLCEEPLVISGEKAMAFAWVEDYLTATLADVPSTSNTSFVLQARDLDPLPDLVEFGKFLCASLTFTTSLRCVQVFVDGKKRLSIWKRKTATRDITEAKIFLPSFKGASPEGLFSLSSPGSSVTEANVEVTVKHDESFAKLRVKHLSAVAISNIPAVMSERMTRVTKKEPSEKVELHLFLAAESSCLSQQSDARTILDEFCPKPGEGRVFIGFKTLQNTGFGAHIAAPFVPTVERELVDLQEPVLRLYNRELLFACGIFCRVVLEEAMGRISKRWREAHKYKGRHGNNVFLDERNVASHRSAFEFSELSVASATSLTDWGEPRSLGVDVSSLRSNRMQHLLRSISSLDLRLIVEDAIAFMRSFSHSGTMPSAEVGQEIIKGFQNCMPTVDPPVLTGSGVVRGRDARLPNQGIEDFVSSNVVEVQVFKSAEGYLRDVAKCPDLSLQDLIQGVLNKTVDEDFIVRLLCWWTDFYRQANTSERNRGLHLKRALVFHSSSPGFDSSERIVQLKDKYHYLKASMFLSPELPVPGSVIPVSLHQCLLSSVLEDPSLSPWFRPLTHLEWARFVCRHSSMTNEREGDSDKRMAILRTLSDCYLEIPETDRSEFENIVRRALSDVRCIPCESPSEEGELLALPSDVYLSTRDLHIFKDIDAIKEASSSLTKKGVSEMFLIALGVQRTVSTNFILANLNGMKWNCNPKPLIEYLRTLELAEKDLQKLKSARYLPEARDKQRMYAPEELCLPNEALDNLPFVKVLQWPTTGCDSLDDLAANVGFLKKLGCAENPPLEHVIGFLKSEDLCETTRMRCLDFLHKGIAHDGIYRAQYEAFQNARFLPCTAEDPLGFSSPKAELHAPKTCYLNEACRCLGFPVLSHKLRTREGLAQAITFGCESIPPPSILVRRLLSVVKRTKQHIGDKDTDKELHDHVLATFAKIFEFLSSVSLMNQEEEFRLNSVQFIPYVRNGSLGWCHPKGIFFKVANDSMEQLLPSLFPTTEFSPFLALCGVRSEPSIADLSKLLRSSATIVLGDLGTDKYYSLLRWMSGCQMSARVVKDLRKSTFLPSYVLSETNDSNTNDEDGSKLNLKGLRLARAKDVCLVDNKKLASMFGVLTAPQEADLEKLYERLGSKYISTQVRRWTKVKGAQSSDTPVTRDLADRIHQRRRVLVSHHVPNSHPKESLEALLSTGHLDICEIVKIEAWYSFKGETKCESITSAFQEDPQGGAVLYVTNEFVWYHVGDAICTMMFTRHGTNDAFYIGSILQASVPELRAQGFAVGSEQSGLNQLHKGDTRRGADMRRLLKSGRSLMKRAGVVASTTHCFKTMLSSTEVAASRPSSVKRVSHMRRLHHSAAPSSRSPEKDREAQKRLEHVLRRSVNLSRRVSPIQISARKTVVHLPGDMGNDADHCEALSGHELKPVAGPHRTGKTSTGVPVFAYQLSETSEDILLSSWNAVERFATVLLRLCTVFKLRAASIAIFHEPNDRTVAFNSKRSLYFNVRYFFSLHSESTASIDCYCYWFTTMAHELAHNTVIQHTKRHGYITQRLISQYLANFVTQIPPVIQVEQGSLSLDR